MRHLSWENGRAKLSKFTKHGKGENIIQFVESVPLFWS